VKNKKKNLIFFVLQIAFFTLAVFLFSLNNTLADEKITEKEEIDECLKFSEDIKINEIFPTPKDDGSEPKKEYVEIKNFGDNCIDISNWKIKDETTKKITISSNSILESGEFFIIETSKYLNDSGDSIYLFDSAEKEVNKKSYPKIIGKGLSYSFDGKNWQWTIPTPGEENELEDQEEDEENYDYDIRINEILPNPNGDEGEKEFVELYNSEDSEINLKNWILKDSSKTEFVFLDSYSIKPKNYSTIYRKDFKFALNNSGGESVYLFNPNGEIASETSYEGSAGENISYGFDGTNWRWSKYLTPNKENKFSKPLIVKIKKIKNGYAKIPIKFKVKVKNKDGNKIKYHWEFGDERVSYLESPSHIFEKNGKYKILLTVKNGIEEVVNSFYLEIKKYPHFKVIISRLMPNPLGNDTGKEWLEIKNNSKKKINLKNWKIATGITSALSNHSILKDIQLKPGETTKLTRADALFSLNNRELKLELRYPDTKTASRLEYKREKIGENEICQNQNGKCFWQLATPSEIISSQNNFSENIIYSEEEIACKDGTDECLELEIEDEEEYDDEFELNEEAEILGAEENYSSESIYSNPLKIDWKNKKIYESDEYYHFTPPQKDRPHWIFNLIENIF